MMAEESPDVRTELALKLWKVLETQSVIDIFHYNALLAVHVENGHPFSVEDTLADMKLRNLEPNRATFQKIIDNYGRNGDLNGMARTLGIMKENRIALNEKMYNSLITAHVLAG